MSLDDILYFHEKYGMTLDINDGVVIRVNFFE